MWTGGGLAISTGGGAGITGDDSSSNTICPSFAGHVIVPGVPGVHRFQMSHRTLAPKRVTHIQTQTHTSTHTFTRARTFTFACKRRRTVCSVRPDLNNVTRGRISRVDEIVSGSIGCCCVSHGEGEDSWMRLQIPGSLPHSYDCVRADWNVLCGRRIAVSSLRSLCVRQQTAARWRLPP